MNPFTPMRRLYERGPGCRGLAVDREGVALGPRVMLVQCVDHRYRGVGAAEMMKLTRAVFGADARLKRLPAVLADIARALERGDLVKAQLLALTIPIGALDDGQLARLAAVADLMKAGFDPNQPRDDHGCWTDTGSNGSANEASPTGAEIADAGEGLSDAGGVLPVADAQSGASPKRNPIDMWEVTDPRKKPVKVVDDKGQEVPDQNGRPMWRPNDMDPHFFVDKGLEAAAAFQDPESGNAWGGFPQIATSLPNFQQGAPWDARRVNGIVVRQYVDYATVAIGLYGAAAGIPIDRILTIQNQYAHDHPRPPGQETDETYRFLPKRNVANTRLGYDLYNSGRIGPSAAR
jgi:hypothetical protein